jgi:hypothetical protein
MAAITSTTVIDKCFHSVLDLKEQEELLDQALGKDIPFEEYEGYSEEKKREFKNQDRNGNQKPKKLSPNINANDKQLLKDMQQEFLQNKKDIYKNDIDIANLNKEKDRLGDKNFAHPFPSYSMEFLEGYIDSLEDIYILQRIEETINFLKMENDFHYKTSEKIKEKFLQLFSSFLI